MSIRFFSKLLLAALLISIAVTVGEVYGNETPGDFCREVAFVGYVLTSWIETRVALADWWGLAVECLINALLYALALCLIATVVGVIFRWSKSNGAPGDS